MWFADRTLISRDADVSAGEIPASMGQLTNLTGLNLGGNQLSGKIRYVIILSDWFCCGMLIIP
jgi:hypothetical protein